MTQSLLTEAISRFGVSCKAKLSNKATAGAPEDQLRGPLEALFGDLASLAGLHQGSLALVGENTIADLKTRPDYAVTVKNALVGFIEVKAPGKGADPRHFTGEHDRKQWAKLKSLPNLLYTDGNAFSLWQDGVLVGKIVRLEGDIETSGSKLEAPDSLLPLIANFLQWTPIPPRNAKQLAEVTARLCRLLRDEVTEELERNNSGLSSLAKEWRGLLFPEADNATFADGYAQAVTFGLLVARARGIELGDGIDRAALELKKSNSLIATALRLLTDSEDVKEALDSALRTLTRVLDAVDWPKLTKGDADAWIYFYEHFLEVYDKKLRKRTGSYYTPPEVVAAMIRLVDEALRDPALFGLSQGLASPEVTLADPAVGTGAYLLGALRKIAETVESDMGPGAVPGAIHAAAQRLIGFEMQFGPFAVAQLRLIAEMQTLLGGKAAGQLPDLRLFITDTLGDPFNEGQFSSMTQAIGESRKQANAIKRGEPITVVIGNPPYKVDAAGMGGWIENGSDTNKQLPAPLDRWVPPVAWGVSSSTKHLKNLYVYFWRWATLKVFGSGWEDVTLEPEQDRAGVVCYITASGFLNGPGFEKMRADLRHDCNDIWVIDCSPDGHQPAVATRIFEGVQQNICIVLAVRRKGKPKDQPAAVHFTALPVGRQADKFAALNALGLRDGAWNRTDKAWRSPFLPERAADWGSFAALSDFFVWATPGVKTHRTWIIAPDVQTLEMRWQVLQAEQDPIKQNDLFHADDGRSPNSEVKIALGEFPVRQARVFEDKRPIVPPVRYAFRSFDRQWMPPDHRLISRARPKLWTALSDQQIYLTAVQDTVVQGGPALSLTGSMPDMHHYHGRGGRVLPLWRDAAATIPNVRPEVLAQLSAAYGFEVSPEDVMAYIAALLAHPAFTARFKADLVRPGLRVPITADANLFSEAAKLGREIVWLHCYGERFADAAEDRPSGAPRMPKGAGPTIPAGGAIPGAPEELPDVMRYDPAKRRLHVGNGFIDNVPQAVWDYEVSGKQVLVQWFSYRRRDRSRPIIGDRRPPSPLDKVHIQHWPDEYTRDLMDLLHVLGRIVHLEPLQADLLDRICAAPLLPPAVSASDEMNSDVD